MEERSQSPQVNISRQKGSNSKKTALFLALNLYQQFKRAGKLSKMPPSLFYLPFTKLQESLLSKSIRRLHHTNPTDRSSLIKEYSSHTSARVGPEAPGEQKQELLDHKWRQ